MKKIDRFILKSFFGPFVMIFLIVIFVLMMQFLWLYIDELVGKGLGFKVIAEFLGWGSATLIPLALPLATLLSSIMTLGSLGENNELLAMKAAGISLPRILTPLTIVTVFICIGAFFASNDLIPVAYNKIYTLRDDINKTKSEIKIPIGVFYDGIDNYRLLVNSKDKETGMMHDIIVYNHSGDKGNTSITVADSGLIKLSEDKKGISFTLFSGTNYEENDKINYRDTSLALQKIRFRQQEVIIPLTNHAFERSDDGRFGNEVMSKDLSRLRKDRDSLTLDYSKAYDKEMGLVRNTLNLRYDRELDSAYMPRYEAKAEYSSKMYLYDSLSTEKKLDVVTQALSKIKHPKEEYSAFERDNRYTTSILRKTKIEMFRKFTLSLACLIFFFIGAPLGAIIRKGGLGTPAIISVLFFVLYWVVDISGVKLAKDGAISPFAGTFISSLVLLPIGVFLTYKATKDSSLFNMDAMMNNIKNSFIRTGKKIRGLFSRKKKAGK